MDRLTEICPVGHEERAVPFKSASGKRYDSIAAFPSTMKSAGCARRRTLIEDARHRVGGDRSREPFGKLDENRLQTATVRWRERGTQMPISHD